MIYPPCDTATVQPLACRPAAPSAPGGWGLATAVGRPGSGRLGPYFTNINRSRSRGQLLNWKLIRRIKQIFYF